MVHTKNDKYTLQYFKGHVSYGYKKNGWVRTKWVVVNNQGTEVWSIEGKLFNNHKQELFKKFKLEVKTN